MIAWVCQALLPGSKSVLVSAGIIDPGSPPAVPCSHAAPGAPHRLRSRPVAAYRPRVQLAESEAGDGPDLPRSSPARMSMSLCPTGRYHNSSHENRGNGYPGDVRTGESHASERPR